MAGLLRRLFGGAAANENAPAAGEPDATYKGVEIFAHPQKENSQWRIGGTLKRTVDDAVVERKFLRADLLDSEDAARMAAVDKARLIIDQNGEALWKGEDRMV